jgi:hypothetical protein
MTFSLIGPLEVRFLAIHPKTQALPCYGKSSQDPDQTRCADLACGEFSITSDLFAYHKGVSGYFSGRFRGCGAQFG